MDSPNLRQVFVDHFGTEPKWLASAPGRVNLIGEHTDYNEGWVFPAAIDRRLTVLAAPTEAKSRLVSLEQTAPSSFDLRRAQPGEPHDWGLFVAGIGYVMREVTKREIPNLLALIHSEIPIGAGLSSSAAIEMAFARIWDAEVDLGLASVELARLGPESGRTFTGVSCGVMDQFASLAGVRGHALFLDTLTLECTPTRIPPELQLVVCHTGRARQLTDSAYNARREQCETAARAMGVPSLRHADLALLENHRGRLANDVFRRAKHVVTENERCRQFRQALIQRNENRIFELMQASHRSLKEDYEVSCAELDAMAESAWGASGCVGARMTGAGFGGCCVAIVRSDSVEEFIGDAQQSYQGRGFGGEFWACHADSGAMARRLELGGASWAVSSQ